MLIPEKFSFRDFRSSDLFFILLIPISLLIFYPELFFAKSGALICDHLEQHYPWAFLFAQELKHGRLPFWTSLIQCGFPLAAEGQVGVFYLPNIFFYLLLPFRWAYSYNQLFHFFIAGLGTYLYARRIKMAPAAASVAAFIYLFGTSYGGAYYNITSLKTLAWFPFLLLVFERMTGSLKKRDILFLTLILSLMVLAGYLQIAVLAFFIFFFYALLRLTFFRSLGFSGGECPQPRLRIVCRCATGGILALVICFPQLFLTYQLAILSNRAGMTEGYTYVGSMFPGALFTFVLPLLQGLFRGNSLYLGSFTVLLTIAGIYSPQNIRNSWERLWIYMAALSLLLALGQWSPLYVGLVKLTHFYAFRTPAKFLIFICFGLALLAGFGFQRLLEFLRKQELTDRIRLSKIGAMSLWVYLISIVAALGTYWMLLGDRSVFRCCGEWYLRTFIYGKAGHPHSYGTYLSGLENWLDYAKNILSLHASWSLWTYAMLFSAIFFAFRLKRSAAITRKWLIGGCFLLALDLYAFAFYDIKTDFASYPTLPSGVSSPIIRRLQEEQRSGHLSRLYGFRAAGDQLPMVPSVNMLFGIEDIGGYSPFILRRYYETIGQLGNVNDSNIAANPSASFVLQHLALLNALDVSHILSREALPHADLELLIEDQKSGAFLYRNKAKYARAHFVSLSRSFEKWDDLKEQLMRKGFDPQSTVLVERSELAKIKTYPRGPVAPSHAEMLRSEHSDRQEIWQINTRAEGFFWVSNVMFPGWKAYRNGEEVPLIYIDGLFQGVWIEKGGSYKIEFKYDPLAIFTKGLKHVSRS